MTIEEFLQSILGGGLQPQNRLVNPWRGENADPSMAMMPMQQSQGAPPEAMMAQGAPQVQPQQQAAPPPSSGGGFLSRLFGGGDTHTPSNQTVQWLVDQGYDPAIAGAMAGDKETLQKVMVGSAGGNKPIEINGKLVDPRTYEVLADFSDPKAAPNRQTAVIDGNLVDTNTGEVIGKYGDDKKSTLINAGDGNLYDPDTGEWIRAPDAGGDGMFEGTSVEAQSLNHLVKTGQLTPDQASQLGAGKTVTNPADGSIIFLTPQGVFGQPAGGGPAQPLVPDAAPAPPVPAATPPAPPPVVAGPSSVPPPAPSVVAPPPAPPPPSAPPVAGGPRPGVIPITEGKPGKLATESETRNRALYTVAAPDLKIALDNFGELENVYSQAASKMLPWGTDNYVTSPGYQRALNSMKTIIATYLYSTSGATANPGEIHNQAMILMPGPNEAPESVTDKKNRLKTMVTAIRQAGGNWTPPAAAPDAPAAPKVRQLAPGVTVEPM